MNTKLKTAFVIPAVICILVLGMSALVSCIHQGPIFNIGNNFDQPVTVYFEGQKMGKLNPGQSKIFYPNEILTKDNSDLLVELKSNSGVVLYSRNFTWDELWAVLQSVTGKPYWIGDATPTSTPTPPPTPTPTPTPTASLNQQPIQVISVLEPPQTPNPGGGIVEITLKNVANEPVVSLAAILTIRGPFNYNFDVTPSHPLLPGNNISAQLRLIGPNDGFGGGIPYTVTINGTLQSGATFAYTWEPIEVVSVLDTYKTGQTVNPGGPEIEITLKNVAVEAIVSLNANLELLSIPAASGLRRSWNYVFDVTPSNPLLPAKSIGSKVRLIGGGFGGSLPYDVTINGTLQSGATFAYTWGPPK